MSFMAVAAISSGISAMAQIRAGSLAKRQYDHRNNDAHGADGDLPGEDFTQPPHT